MRRPLDFAEHDVLTNVVERSIVVGVHPPSASALISADASVPQIPYGHL